jgi:hypothetical protein
MPTFVGAGFSLNAKLPPGRTMPAWAGLTQRLAEIANVSPGLSGPEVASKFEERFGRVQLIEAIRKALHTDYAEPGDAHLAFVGLPFDTIYTTNFDLLLEDAFQRLKKPLRSIVGELQMPFHGGRLTATVVKMHGDLRHEEHIVVTAEDYSGYLENYPVIATHLAAQLITKTPLFIGYSLTDPDFNNIREIVRSRLGKFHRMGYLVAFDAPVQEVDAKLKEHLHVISLSTSDGRDKASLLQDFFAEVQQHLDVDQAVRIRGSRPDAFEVVATERVEQAARQSDAAPLLTSSSNLCFVMMPFGQEFDRLYYEFIKASIEQFGLTPLRADEIPSTGLIMEQIRVSIQQSRLCVADVSQRNPNVLYEVGIAHTLGKPTILLTSKIEEVPFDIRALRIVVYDPNEPASLRAELVRTIEVTLGQDRLEEAQRLVDIGNYRAAAALLGVVLEQDLRLFMERNSATKGGRAGAKPMSIGQSVTFLTAADLLANVDGQLLKQALRIRNRAVHEVKEVGRDEVLILLDAVQTFRRKYLALI